MTPSRLRVAPDAGGTFIVHLVAIFRPWALLVVPLPAAITGALPAAADVVDSPECRQGMAIAGRLIEAVARRENGVRPGDWVGRCRLLRLTGGALDDERVGR